MSLLIDRSLWNAIKVKKDIGDSYMEEKKLYTVKEVCEKYGITRKTLFYYDKTGLLSPTKRLGNQLHKVYDIKEIQKLEMILRLRNAGLTISEIKEMTKLTMKIIDYRGIMEKARQRLLKEKSRKEKELRNLEALIAEYERRSRQCE